MQWTIPIYRLYKDEHKDTIPQPANDESALWLDFVHNLITKLHTNVPRARSWCHYRHHHHYNHYHHNHNLKKTQSLKILTLCIFFPSRAALSLRTLQSSIFLLLCPLGYLRWKGMLFGLCKEIFDRQEPMVCNYLIRRLNSAIKFGVGLIVKMQKQF